MNSLSAFCDSLAVSSSTGSSSACASCGMRSGLRSSSCGLTQIDSTGVDTASGSPLRSVIMPREVAIGSSRR
ncbi:hypothetical protein NB697_003357 [Xanthomonas sacchari]|nr:hypothetical protein [Xanthomonas sacchari]MCW0416649.1 hypothetical protein [Xanthomonas sacchari]MCW0438835.1 hypothetical protein [Xanthomonas sacchari]MCW0449916.1 hypothetical protein [Xanthomonas sacchari]MCW0466295.1 hypothetical protein [Xanthomonas sacchari]